MIEEWKIVPGYGDKYSISNYGRLLRYSKEVVIKPNKKGYFRTALSISDRPKRSVGIHALVMEVFVSPRPENHDVHHIDHNRANNRQDNLEYIPKPLHGLTHCGVVAKYRPIPPDVLPIILSNYTKKRGPKLKGELRLTARELAVKYDISRYAIWRAQRSQVIENKAVRVE